MIKSLLLGAALTLSGPALAAPQPHHTPTPFNLPQTDLTPAPAPPAPVEIPIGKCSTDITLLDTLEANNYKTLLKFADLSRPEVQHVLYYSSVDSRFVLAHSVSVTGKPSEISKVCIEYIGDHPVFDGATFRTLVLTQHTLDKQTVLDATEAAKKAHREKQDEPYSGDPNKS